MTVMLKDMMLSVEITFPETANEQINFPINYPLRLSFWLADLKYSTPSEIQIEDKRIEIGQPSIVDIKILPRDFFEDKLKVGAKFTLGPLLEGVGFGRILEIKQD